MTEEDVEVITSGTAAVMKEVLKARDLRLAALEARTAALETKSAAGVQWAGTFEQGKAYAAGSLSTCAGSLWLAKADTAMRPGSDPTAWVLVCKRGDFDDRRKGQAE